MRYGRTSVAKIGAQVQLTDVSQVGLTQYEASIIGHPHSQDLVVITLHDFLGNGPLLGTIRGLAQGSSQYIDDGVVEAEIILWRLRVHILIGAFVETHRVPGLAAPGSAVPFAVGIATKVGRIIVLGDLQLNVEVTLQILLYQLDLRGHLGKVLIVEQCRLKAIGIAGLRQEFFGVLWTVLPPGAEVRGNGSFVLEIKIRNTPADHGMPFIESVDLLLSVDSHRHSPASPYVLKRRFV